MKVQEIMVLDPIRVREEDSLFEVAEVLSRRRFHAVPVVDETETLVGIITQYDLFLEEGEEVEYLPAYIQRLLRIAEREDTPESVKRDIKKFSHMKAKDIMTSKCLTLTPDLGIEEAIHTFQQTNFGSIPVIDGHKKLVGVVTVHDILGTI